MKKDSKEALVFVLLLGAVSLLADVTYEGARSVTGPYLALLGASAATVGVVAGLGEFIGHGLRILFGILSDRTRRYWFITLTGYAVNLIAVPALALAGRWEWAAALIMTERLGKAVRAPARDAMLSHAAHALGRGWAFGVHEAMDQVGAMLGPVVVSFVLAWRGSYPYAFAALSVPAVLALAVLAVARLLYPRPEALEALSPPDSAKPLALRSAFWLYLAAAGLVAAGFADYPLIAFHMKATRVVPDHFIPLLYSGAMGMDALSALVLGRLYDKKGLSILPFVVGASAWFAPLVFSSRPEAIALGMGLWGIGLGAQESVIRAVVSDIVPHDRRATGYGIFNAGFGLAWFMGSALMGMLYDRSLTALIIFSVLAQAASVPFFLMAHTRLKKKS